MQKYNINDMHQDNFILSIVFFLYVCSFFALLYRCLIGCLMILAWVLFTGIGIIAARFYKNVWADKTFLDLKIWFQVRIW